MDTGVWALGGDRAKNVQAPVVHIVNLWSHRKAYLSQQRHLPQKITPLLHRHPPELLHGQPLNLWRHWPYSPGQWGGQSFLDVPDPLPAHQRGWGKVIKDARVTCVPTSAENCPWTLSLSSCLWSGCVVSQHLSPPWMPPPWESPICSLTSFHPSTALLNSRRCFSSPIYRISAMFYVYKIGLNGKTWLSISLHSCLWDHNSPQVTSPLFSTTTASFSHHLVLLNLCIHELSWVLLPVTPWSAFNWFCTPYRWVNRS